MKVFASTLANITVGIVFNKMNILRTDDNTYPECPVVCTFDDRIEDYYYLNSTYTKRYDDFGGITDLKIYDIDNNVYGIYTITSPQGDTESGNIYKIKNKNIYLLSVESFGCMFIDKNLNCLDLEGHETGITVYNVLGNIVPDITWYDEPTPEDSNSRLKRIIRKLPLRLDVKNKIIKYVFGEEK